MMAPEPLRSATSVGVAEDTSLALPSDSKLRSGQQRVLDQVHSIKRGKSKHGKNGSASSPTSPSSQPLTAYSDFASFKFSPSKANGTFSRSKSTISTGFSKERSMQKTRSLSTRAGGGRYSSTSGVWEQQMNASTSPNGLKPSRSDPTLAPPFSAGTAPSMRVKGPMTQGQSTLQTRINRQSISSVTSGNQMTSSQARIVRAPSTQSHSEGKMGTMKLPGLEQKSMVNTTMNMPDLTLKDAVEFLSHPDENYQQWGATFIQHTTYTEDSAKSEVLDLGGIPALVALLRSPSPGVSQAAAGALRNLVFKNHSNKLVVQHCGGIAKALQLLKETESTETQKQVTGLLWNLSSARELKEELTATALPALTENVVVPFTIWSDSSTSNHIDPQVFHSAAGCLRNLSCGENERQAMRKCPSLIDSLMSYLQSCVAEENPDDMSVENCACILHNLSYQLENECPESLSSCYPYRDAQPENKNSPIIGCFSPKSSKVQKEFSFDAVGMLDDSTPSGVKWLSHPKAMETYLSLLGSSKKDATLEACCGALQNLTANKGQVSDAVSQILVNKFKALNQFTHLLKSPNQSLQKTAVSLVGNMSRTSSLQTTLAKQVLPQLTDLLRGGSYQMGNVDDTIATTCKTALKLMLADSEVGKRVITDDLVHSLNKLSEENGFSKGSKAASVMLYGLWNDKNLQSIVKKLGFKKSFFVNDITKEAYLLQGE